MLLGWSRAVYVEFVEKCDLGTLLSCHIHAFEAFGSAQNNTLPNLKAVVSAEKAKVLWNSRFAGLALLFVHSKACRAPPGTDQGKGREGWIPPRLVEVIHQASVECASGCLVQRRPI